MFLRILCVLALFAASASLQAKQLDVSFELPTIESANYHNPYVAIWIESKEKKETLLLWHLNKNAKDKWLADIRRWWRKQGRYGDVPDGVTGATKGPGKYNKSFNIEDVTKFKLYIEVVREDGGRSLMKQAIDFDSEQKEYNLAADKEVGPINIKIGK
ncbi:MAG: DUF2271 domain-containing protein [Thalassotalea sp.]|nr:DUF2271 domain-containing protein [Thalassotalea sp.]